MSEELENSLQQAVETYLHERLRPINDQIASLQTDMSEAMARLREASTLESLDGTTLSAAIFAHLQTARGQRLSGATLSPAAASDAGAIKRAVTEIENQQSQTDILKALLSSSVQFAERVAMFIVKNNQAIGWRVSNASDPANSQPIGGVSVPLSAHTGLTKAIYSRGFWSGMARENVEDDLLLDQLGGSPRSAAAVPLVVRGKVVAALYADSASADAGAINSDALEILARVAAMTVNIVSIHRSAALPKQEVSRSAPKEAVRSVPAPVAPEAAPVSTPYVEPHIEEVPSAPEAPSAAPPVETIPAESDESLAETQPLPATDAAQEPPAESVAQGISSETAEVNETQPVAGESASALQPGASPEVPAASPEPPVASPQPQSAGSISEVGFNAGYSTPLGSARRYGVSEPELPIEVGDDERRLHNDARRFARLLVSEIKLYNENKVREGRSNADLYTRLRDDIDRSRQMYDKRVAPPVAARHDYFHQELVNLLAEGDPAKLGHGYPGAP